MNRILAVLAVVTVAFAAGCASESDDPDPGDNDDVGDGERPEPDRSHWQPVTACVGFDLCLENIVAATDLDLDPEDRGVDYPMQTVLGDVFELPNMSISRKCADSFEVDADKNLTCLPGGNEDEAFEVGHFARVSTNESGVEVIVFDYATPGRATLLRDPASTGQGFFHLEIE